MWQSFAYQEEKFWIFLGYQLSGQFAQMKTKMILSVSFLTNWID